MRKLINLDIKKSNLDSFLKKLDKHSPTDNLQQDSHIVERSLTSEEKSKTKMRNNTV